jgi:peptidoglycan/LPS O-acetylase OafA/YrhL
MRHRVEVPAAKATSSRLRNFRPDIEGLRFPLILMVVLYHIGFKTQGGVDGSVALSGALGAFVIKREIDKYGGFSFGGFYARRARRLLPLATVVIVATVLATMAFVPSFGQSSLVFDALAAAGFVINFRLAANDVIYGDDSDLTSPLQHYWSLAVEEQFWLLLPIFMVGIVWLCRRFNLGLWPLVVSLVTVTGASLALSVIQTQSAQAWAYFGTHTRIWEFGLGALVALAMPSFSRINQNLAAVLSWAGIGALLAGMHFIAQAGKALPGAVVAWPVVGVCLVIAGGSAAPKYGAELLLGLKPIRFLGRMSYGWYLWHWPALILMPRIFGYERYDLRWEIPIAAGTLLLAVGTYYAIERPVKSWNLMVEVPIRGLKMGARLIAVSGAAAGLLFTHLTVQGSAAPKRAEAIKPEQIKQLVLEAAQVQNLSPVAEARMTTVKERRFGGCLNDIKVTEAQPCFLGASNGEKTIALLGSSLMWQWIPAFDEIALQSNMRLVVFSKGSCPAQPYSVDTEEYMVQEGLKRGVYEQCDEWRKDAYQQIKDLGPEMVVLSSRMEQESSAKAIDSGVRFFKDRGMRVVLLGETPGFDFDLPTCIAANPGALQKCSRPLNKIVDLKKINEAAEAARKAGATVIDPLPWLCTDVCPAVIDDQPVYQDSRHLAAAFVVQLSELLKKQLQLTI